jgi:hypothetical protein
MPGSPCGAGELAEERRTAQTRRAAMEWMTGMALGGEVRH